MKLPPHQRHVLDNGVQLLLLPRADIPLIAFEALLRGGARLDPPERAGTAALLAEMLLRGAGSRDAYAFAEAIEDAGATFDALARAEAIVLHGQFLADDQALLLELLADAVQRPHLSNEELEDLRARHIESLQATKASEPRVLTSTYGRALLFGEHPFARPSGGSEATLARIERADLLNAHSEQFGPERVTLVFAGDFAPATLIEAVSKAFGSWRHAAAKLPPLLPPPRIKGRHAVLVDVPGSTQSYFWLANVGVAADFAQRAALEITNTAFGGSFGSMLMQTLRVQAGLTYSASSRFHRGSVAGEFAISSFTETASTAAALDLTLQTLDRLKRERLGPEQLAAARNYLLGHYPLGFETNADWAAAVADLELYRLPASYIDDFESQLQRVGSAAAAEVIATAFPDSADVYIAVIGDARQVRPDLRDRCDLIVERSLRARDFGPGPPRGAGR